RRRTAAGETHRSYCQQWFPPRDRVQANAMPVGLDLSSWEFRAGASFCRPISGCKHVEEAEVDSSLLECMYCLCLLFWCVPDFLVHPRGFLAIVFRHSSDGENFAAVRVGQQVLQGSHLTPTAFLRRLHDTHLESAHVAVDGLPVKGVPFRRLA